MILSPTPEGLEQAVVRLAAGQLVGLPTETVYGLAADADNPQAVARIFAAKGRPADHPLIVHVGSQARLDDWAIDIPEVARQLAAACWPGPLTLILRRHPRVPDAVTGGQDTVGLRMPAHPVALALLDRFAGGLAAPSANRYGRISPTSPEHVVAELGHDLLVLDGGPCQVGIESTIVDCSRGAPVILRLGQLSPEQLAAVVGHPVPVRSQARPEPRTVAEPAAADTVPRVSGSLAAHYAPRTPLEILPRQPLTDRLLRHAADPVAVAWLGAAPDVLLPLSPRHQQVLPADADGYARELYAVLRQLDDLGCARILLEQPPSEPAWAAIHDRLGRAAVGSGASCH